MTTKKPIKKDSESDRTLKIYLTLDRKIVRALEILAGDPRDKSKEIEKIINEYVEFRAEHLKELKIYYRIMAALRWIYFDDTIVDKIDFIDEYIADNPDKREIKEIWLRAKNRMDTDKISLVYDKISNRINNLEANIDNFL